MQNQGFSFGSRNTSSMFSQMPAYSATRSQDFTTPASPFGAGGNSDGGLQEDDEEKVVSY